MACAGVLAWGPTDREETSYWVFLTDKGQARERRAVARYSHSPSPKVQARWERAGWLGDDGDLPVCSEYVHRVEAFAGPVHRKSRWLNAVSVRLSSAEKDEVKRLAFVRRVQPVAIYRRSPEHFGPAGLLRPERKSSGHLLDYGASLHQMEMVQIPNLHDRGFTGEGVTIAMFDTGFRKDHQVFRTTELIDEYDFVFDDGNVQDEPGDVEQAHFHGTATWSLVGGRRDGKLIGGAFSAGFLLAKTEFLPTETVVEEDNWVAALEWADERGADIVSSSLGYSDWYTEGDMDGRTAITSIAASAASKRGILIVNSVGNGGDAPQTLFAPADAFGILAVGAVSPGGTIKGFSSRGPTADGRIKPDVAAQGENVLTASSLTTSGLTRSHGTSFSAPLVAGGAAVLLSAHPDWSPTQLREALMKTATRAGQPDNDYGYGLPQVAAANAFLPTNAVEIDHTPLKNQPSSAGAYEVSATVRAYWGVQTGAASVYYRVGSTGGFTRLVMAEEGDSEYAASIPSQPAGSQIEYYIQARDTKGRTRRRPYAAPAEHFSFKVKP